MMLGQKYRFFRDIAYEGSASAGKTRMSTLAFCLTKGFYLFLDVTAHYVTPPSLPSCFFIRYFGPLSMTPFYLSAPSQLTNP
jgi:hypothetical protein